MNADQRTGAGLREPRTVAGGWIDSALLDEFAKAALTGFASNPHFTAELTEEVLRRKASGVSDRDAWSEILAGRAYAAAGAMLVQRQLLKRLKRLERGGES